MRPVIIMVVLVGCWTDGISGESTMPVEHRVSHRTVRAADDRDAPLLGSGIVEGVVTDIWTNNAIAGVTVELAGASHKRSTVTDRNGYYRFDHVASGDYDCDLEWDQNATAYGTPVGLARRPFGVQRRQAVTVGEGTVVRLDMTADLQGTSINVVLPY